MKSISEVEWYLDAAKIIRDCAATNTIQQFEAAWMVEVLSFVLEGNEPKSIAFEAFLHKIQENFDGTHTTIRDGEKSYDRTDWQRVALAALSVAKVSSCDCERRSTPTKLPEAHNAKCKFRRMFEAAEAAIRSVELSEE